MATLYFTTNADSGSGSLRQALANAAPGDSVTPDPGVAWGGNVIAVALASPLVITKDVTCDGGGFWIELDGQGTVRCLNASSAAAAVFRRVRFVDGKTSAGGGLFYSSHASAVTAFEGCFFTGGQAANYGGCAYVYKGRAAFRDCVVTGGRAVTGPAAGGIRFAATARQSEITRCTVAGNAGKDVSSVQEDEERPVVVDSIIGSATGQIETRAPSECGFAAPPPDAFDVEDWTPNAWRAFDLRLTDASPCLTGASSVLNAADYFDALGRPRRPGGALGAYEGAWFVARANTETRITRDVEVDCVEIADGAVATFVGPDRILAARESASVGAAAVRSETNGFLAAPSFECSAGAAFTNVERCGYGAGITALTAAAVGSDAVRVSWTAQVPERGALIQRETGGVWTTVAANAAVSPITVAGCAGRVSFRAFDGERFVYGDARTCAGTQFSVVAMVTAAERAARNWEAVVATVGVTASVMTGQSVTVLARIFDAFDSDAPLINDGTNVVSVTYTCSRATNGLFDELVTPVPGHENVDAGPDCVLASVQTSDAWTADGVGYNFVLTPDTRTYPLFEKEGEYQIKVTVALAAGNPIVFYAPVSVSARA